MQSAIADTLHITRGALVSIIGAGGKTTLMYRLAEELSVEHRIIITTTTKIWPPSGMSLLLLSQPEGLHDRLDASLDRCYVLAIGERIDQQAKLIGIEPQQVCDLRTIAEIVLCEADGAAGRPLKVHGPGEPVIPDCSTHLLVVAGLDVLGRAAGPDVVHRAERYEAVTGKRLGELVDAEAMACALAAAARFAPPTASVVFILNKADDASRLRAGHDLAVELRGLVPQARVFLAQLETASSAFPSIYSV